MGYLKEWRGFDIASRQRKIANAFQHQKLTRPEDFPLIINTPCYFGFGNDPMPEGYWERPEVMVKYQEDGFLRHLQNVDDDTVPYFMPWFGPGVIASAFGCKVKPATGKGDDPGICSTCVSEPADIARLKMPDPARDGDMPRVLRFIEYAVRHSDLPVGLTDMNSPLCTAAQICGYENLFMWMYDEPEAVHELMEKITECFIRWTITQKEIIGEPLSQSNGLQGLWSPNGVGVWMSDDDLVSVGAEQYAEFVVPYYERILKTFTGGTVHYCGIGTHQLENLYNMKHMRAVNNSPMGHFDHFRKLADRMRGKHTVIIQDGAPLNHETYYDRLLADLPAVEGMILATFVEDGLALGDDGQTMLMHRDALEVANGVARSVRKAVGKVLARNGVWQGDAN
jgi:hypothetical protein